MSLSSILFVTFLSVAMILIAIVAYFGKKTLVRNYYRKRILEIDDDLQKLYEFPISPLLKRIEAIGAFSPNFRKLHKLYRSNYDDIVEHYLSLVAELKMSLEKALAERNFEKLRKYFYRSKYTLSLAEVAILKLSKNLEAATKVSNIQNMVAVAYKKNFQELIKIYSFSKHSLSVADKFINELQTEIDKSFKLFEHQTNEGDFEKTKLTIEKIAKSLRFFGEILQELPVLFIFYDRLIPERIFELTKMYEMLIKQKFDLEKIYFSKALDQLEKNQKIIFDNLQKLNTHEAREAVQKSLALIKEKKALMELEKKSSIFVKKYFPLIHNNYLSLSEVYKKSLNHISFFYKTHEINSTVIENTNSVQKSFKDLKKLVLDFKLTLSDNSKFVSYSYLVRDLEISCDYISDIVFTCRGLLTEISQIRTTKQFISEQITNLSIALLELENKISIPKYENLKKKYVAYINENTVDLKKVEDDFQQPHSFEKETKIKQHVQNLYEKITSLYKQINYQYQLNKLNEKIIIYANRYRHEDPEITKIMNDAEQEYKNTSYEKSVNTLLAMLQQIESSKAESHV